MNVGQCQAARACDRAGRREGAYGGFGTQPGRRRTLSGRTRPHRSSESRPPKGTCPLHPRNPAPGCRRSTGPCTAAGRRRCSQWACIHQQGPRLPWPQLRTHALCHPLTAEGLLRRVLYLWSDLLLRNLLVLLGMRADFGPVHSLRIPIRINSDSIPRYTVYVQRRVKHIIEKCSAHNAMCCLIVCFGHAMHK